MNDLPGRLRCLAGIHPHLNKDAQELLNQAADAIELADKDGILMRLDRLESAVMEINPGLNWAMTQINRERDS